jgi:hypothetical protein
MIEITNYYALPGQLEAVLAQRKHTSEVRVQLGLPAGRIFVKLEGSGPDVRWECAFETREAYDKDMAVRAGSMDFAATRRGMHALIEKFERNLQQEIEEK